MAHYDDPNYLYTTYWKGRDYEDQAERTAIKRLLNNHNFSQGTDLGGGYGRLTPLFASYCKSIYLIEPSLKLRLLAKLRLRKQNVRIISGTAQKIPLPEKSLDFLAIIRVFHHIPDLVPTFSEITRVLKPGGYLLIEYANSANFKSVFNSILSGKSISATPIEKRSPKNRNSHIIDFVNHHPREISTLLQKSGYSVVGKLSVSNFRSTILKRLLPISVLRVLEWGSQSILAPLNFGPSMFVLAQKK